MGPNERRALEREKRDLLNSPLLLSQWQARRLDEINELLGERPVSGFEQRDWDRL